MATLGPLLETMAKINRKCLSPRIAFFQWAVSCCQLSWGLKLWVWNVLHVWQGCLGLEAKVIFSTREIFRERVLSFDLSGVLSHLKRLCKLFLLTISDAYTRQAKYHWVSGVFCLPPPASDSVNWRWIVNHEWLGSFPIKRPLECVIFLGHWSTLRQTYCVSVLGPFVE